MKILAMDLGTQTGWAYWDGFRLESGVQVFDVKRGESPGIRYMRFNRWLDEMVFAQATNGQGLMEPVGEPRAELIVYEQAHQRGGAATEVAAGFSTRVQEFCARHHLEHQATHSGALKKFTTGKGNAKKPDMIRAVSERWKVVESDDEADAIALLYHALHDVIGPVRA